MLITSVRLRNFCQHVDRLIEFSPQLNVIVGPNGCGKSTILNAILFALTGINRLAGKNEENISQFAAPDAESFVDLRFAHRGNSYAVMRSLAPIDTMTLSVNGQTPIRGVTKCVDRILTDLGSTITRMQDYVFVEQRRVDGWFDKRPADRAKEMATLFGLDDAEAATKVIDKFTAKVPLPTTGVNIDALSNERARESHFLSSLEQQLATYADVPADITAYLEERNRIRVLHQQQSDNARRRAEIADNLEALTDSLRDREQRKAVLTQEADEYRLAIESLAPVLETAKADQQQWNTYRQSLQMQTLVETTTARLFNSWRARNRRPKKPDVYLKWETPGWHRMEELRERSNALHVSIKALARLPDDQPCPTCGAVGKYRAEHLASLQTELATVEAELQPLQAHRKASLEYDDMFSKYLVSIRYFKEAVADAKRQRKALQACNRPAMEELEIKQILDDYTTLQNAQHKVQTELAGIVATITSTQFQIAGLQTEAAALRSQQTISIVADMLERAIAEQQVMQTRYQEKKALETHIASHTVRVNGIQQRIDDATAIIAKHQQTTYALSQLSAAKSILHHSAAPRDVTRARLGMLMADIDAALQLFDAPFHVTVDEELTFWAHFRDGRRKQSDKRLSVGQRVALALSWRVALNTAFAGSLGLLALDEPTAGLDVKNLGCVPRAFARLRDLSQTRGLQVLLVTHEERLIDSFDKVISL
jgi:DNA repair exonuclease SbcCD ATPase subunit